MRIIGIVLLLFLGLWRCSDDKHTSPMADRTVIVYLGVDNNFSGEDDEKIAGLTEGWKENFTGHLLVYADPRPKGSGSDNPQGEPYLTEILWENGKAVAREVKRYKESNSADPVVFRRVLSEIVDEYPAQSYGLVVLSHASGWLPSNTLVSPRSVISDGGKEMEVRDFVTALPVKMSFVIFDACLMGGVEVAYEFKDYADYLVFSPAEVLVPGFVYKTMMGHLMKEKPDLTAVAREFYEYYDKLSGAWRSATVTVLDVSKMEALTKLAKELLAGVDGEKRLNIGHIQRYGYGWNNLYFDLGDYLETLYPQRVGEIEAALNTCIVYKAHTPGYYSAGNGSYSAIDFYSGLTVYIPQEAYPYMNNEYKKMKWTQQVNPYIP